MKKLVYLLLCLATPVLAQKGEGLHTADPAPVIHDGVTVWLDELDISEVTQGFDAFAPLGLKGRQQARDLWRQIDVATVDTDRESLPLTIPAHGIVLYKFTSMP